MTKAEISYGIVGFFDILGYASFLENNEPEEAARIVTDTLLQLKSSLGKYQEELFPGEDLQKFRDIFRRIESLVFSDTILLTLPYRGETDVYIKNRYWILFVANAILLYRHLFDCGLPIRGALACGKYLIHETCFVGRNIIEAYRVTQELDFAGVVFTPSAAAEVERLDTPKDFRSFRTLVRKYRVPLRGAHSESMLTLGPSLGRVPKQKLPSDVRQYVAEAFWKHNKDLPRQEIKKIGNTELYLRFFRMKKPGLFDKEGEPEQKDAKKT